MFSIALMRSVTIRRFGSSELSREEMPAWKRRFFLQVMLSAVSISVGALLFLNNVDLTHQAVIICILAMFAAAGLSTLAGHFQGYVAFALILLLPQMMFFLQTRRPDELVLALLIGIFLAVLADSAGRGTYGSLSLRWLREQKSGGAFGRGFEMGELSHRSEECFRR